MKTRRVLYMGLATAVAVLLMAPAAMAVKTTVRVEASDFTAVPTTAVDEPSGGGTYTDTAGDTGTTSQATAFGATGLATYASGTTWDFTWGTFGAFVNAFDGQTSDPATWADWWQYTVNGFAPSIGASSLPSVAGDEYLWFQNPDATFSRGIWGLVVTPSTTALLPGQSLTVSVKGDDLKKVNSQEDATRFEIVDPSNIQTPAEFPAVEGTTIHVGSRAYAAIASDLTIDGLPKGTWWVWAEKPMDSSLVYARSARIQVNVGDAPAITKTGTRPAKYARNRPLKIRFTTNKAMANVTCFIKTAKGKVVFKQTLKNVSSGPHALTWTGKGVPTARRLGKRLIIRLTGKDTWGRTAKPVTVKTLVKH